MTAAPEIGSDFDLDPRSLARPPTTPWGWVQDPATTRTMSGREALRLLLRDAATEGRCRLLLPAYLCDSVEQAAQGVGDWEVEYLPMTDRLEPRADALGEALARDPERTVLVHVQVFARPWSTDLDTVLSEATSRGATVLEDRTHTLLSASQPQFPRAFASARKWLPLPDGGLAWGAAGSPDPTDETAAGARRDAMQAKHAYLTRREGDKDAFLNAFSRTEHALDAVHDVRAMSSISQALLESADLSAIALVRRENHDVLRRAIEESPAIQDEVVPFEPDLAPGAVPLGLPVVARQRDDLRRFLIRNRVYCPIHWPLPDAVADGPHPVAQARNRQLLTLVIDQRYSAADMARVATLLEEFASR